MQNKILLRCCFLIFIHLIAWKPIQAQVKIDTTAVAIFWELADTLAASKKPSAALWEAFANHPAYVQIQKSGNRVTHLKRVLPLVFSPDQAEKLKQVLEGKESFTQFLAAHLHEVKLKRKELDAYLKSANFYAYKNSFLIF